MSGQFAQRRTRAQAHAFLCVFAPPRIIQPHYDVTPTKTVDVIHRGEGDERKLVPIRRGLCEWPVSRRLNHAGTRDHDPTTVRPC